MKLDLTHRFACSAETLTAMIFDDELNRRIHLEDLGFDDYKLVDEWKEGAISCRRLLIVPKLDAPKAIRRLIGDRFTYREEWRCDLAARIYNNRMVPSVLADKITIEWEERLRDDGDGACIRSAVVSIEARMFGIGRLVEHFAAKSVEEGNSKWAAAIERRHGAWVADRAARQAHA